MFGVIDFALSRDSMLVTGEASVSEPAQNDANFDIPSAKCDLLSAPLGNFNSQCDT